MPGVRFSLEQNAKAVRLVAEATPQPESQWAAIESVASKIGASAETVRKWVRRAEVDAGVQPQAAALHVRLPHRVRSAHRLPQRSDHRVINHEPPVQDP